jgi:hypothetical protein
MISFRDFTGWETEWYGFVFERWAIIDGLLEVLNDCEKRCGLLVWLLIL